MRPVALAEGDFIEAVGAAARRFTGEAALALSFAVTGRARRLHADAEAMVLRIIQESLANVAKHAGARAVRLTLAYGRRRLRVTVADDGRGFAVERDFRSYAGHWGLLGMQERAGQAGGSLKVRSAPGCGTEVTVLVPFGRRPAHAT
jgi:signal transduction histidine kinase